MAKDKVLTVTEAEAVLAKAIAERQSAWDSHGAAIFAAECGVNHAKVREAKAVTLEAEAAELDAEIEKLTSVPETEAERRQKKLDELRAAREAKQAELDALAK